MATIILLFLSLLLLIIFLSNNNNSEAIKLPPGPPDWPVVDNFFQVASSSKPFIHYVRELAGVYGPIFTLRMGARTLVVVSGAELAHEVLIDKKQLFADRSAENPTRTVFSCDKFTVNSALYGPEWRSLPRRSRGSAREDGGVEEGGRGE